MFSAAASSFAADPPSTGDSKTIPGTNGYLYGRSLPSMGGNHAPETGGIAGVQIPRDKGQTRVRCTRDGKEVPC
jgi:hypothetical protein